MKTLIGNTPMIKIRYKYHGVIKCVYAKLEYYNLTGSIKDRMVNYILKGAKKEGRLKEGEPLIEATSGNTGISLAAYGARYHHPVYIFMPNWVSVERKKLMESFGATVYLITKEQGGFERCIKEADALTQTLGGFRLNQFSNLENVSAHYNETAEEILEDMKHHSFGGFVSGIGTGGTLMGIGLKLKELEKDIVLAAIEPDTLSLLTNGNVCGSHKIEGIGDDFIPEIVDRNLIDDVLTIHDDDAILLSQMLAQTLGLGLGISSGANLLGAILLEEKIGLPVVTVFPDDNKKYITTDLMKEQKIEKNSIVQQIELLDYEIM